MGEQAVDLREHFERAVDDDPGADPAVMANAAIARGGQVRRRRRQVAGAAGGVLAVLGIVAGLNLPSQAEPALTVAAAMRPPAAPSCSVDPVERDATDVAIFLKSDTSVPKQAALASALGNDPRVATVVFESRSTAYEKFRRLWADSPDFVDAVSPKDLPESFRVRLVDAAQFTAFQSGYAARSGVQDIVGRICPVGAAVGGVQ
ncbi:permease-like cell division protein FtsX [Paractinoplanes hotanensis]|uniref:Permease-like cell division protein FtsX n=1 Tax=Paractinoplanes hotanensis TaxID=2906497 RepID=A0ABT0YH31_9ACTN|nr:permease-like cell division protein FtsX [Actinoplanes hotanensis]MCM4085025.1 permease-like cell division protein FtsX [Actinoplanes hotanensis]